MSSISPNDGVPCARAIADACGPAPRCQHNPRIRDYNCPLGCIGRAEGPIRKHAAGGVDYQLFECASCDLMFWCPREFPDQGFYDHLEFGSYVVAHSFGRTEIGGHHMGFVESFHQRGGKLLDVGCSDGNFLAWAKDAGYDVYGLDVDKVAIQHARRVTSNVWNMSLDDFTEYAAEHQLRFDTITMFETLEHQPDPLKVLIQVRRLLLPGGQLAGTVPNRERLVKTGRHRWLLLWDFPPHHFLWFSKTALANSLRGAGFPDPQIRIRENGYGIEEVLRCAGQRVKANFLGRTSRELPLEDLERIGLETSRNGMRLMYLLRALKDLVKLPPKAVEILLEHLLGKGGSLYFEGRNPSERPARSGDNQAG